MPAALLRAALLSCPPAAATPGDLDPTFGDGGRTLTHVDELTVGYPASMAIQADGRIVVVGGGEEVLAVRYRTDGGLDGSFAGDGTVHLPFGRGEVSATVVAIDEEGKDRGCGGHQRPRRAP